jgi:hypothetical protein
MKKIVTISICCLSFSYGFSQASTSKPVVKSNPTQTAKVDIVDLGYKFDKTSNDYGTILKGGEPICEFKLTNTSKEMLVITEAHGSCGCTVPEYSKEPIKPGQTVGIKVRYDTNRIGPFDKQVTITFQGKEAPAVIRIHGTVSAPISETPFPSPGSVPANGGVPVNN